MSQGNDFANYASSAEDRSSASEDVWFVAVSSDDIKQMNVDQLDEAFRLGVITAQTAVWTEGMEAWAPLGEVADLDADGDSSEVAAPQPSASSPESVPSQRRTNPGWQNPFDAPASTGPSMFSDAASNSLSAHSHSAHSHSAHSHSANSLPANSLSANSLSANSLSANSLSTSSMGPSSFAPVTASYAPSTASALGQSTGPVALNVDEDMPAVSRGRRFRPERWLLAAAGVIAVGVIGFNNADLFSSKSMAAAEKQASAAALVTHPYELGADKSAKKGAAPAEKADKDDGKDAPIGSLKGEAGEEDHEAAVPAAVTPDPVTKPGSSAKDSTSKESASKDSKDSVRGGFAKAFSKNAPAAKPAKSAKPAKASKQAHKTPARATASAKPKKGGGVAHAASAFDPLNGSLP